MAISNNEVHDNLVLLANRMNGGNEDEFHNDVKGLASLAGNEEETEIADSIQTLSFSTWISDICDGLKQERELTRDSKEYDETAQRIRDNIQNINNLGQQLGIKHEIIPMPKKGYESQAAAQAVYNCVALPYEAGANVDYSKYIQAQELNNEISRSMKQLSHAVAENASLGGEAKAYWKAAEDTAKHQDKLSAEFLNGVDSVKEYEVWIKEQKAFLDDISKENKVDFENDDKSLYDNMKTMIARAEGTLKTERAMLQAGHIDSGRKGMFQSTMSSYVNAMKKSRKDIKADYDADMRETRRLEDRFKNEPEKIPEDLRKEYMKVVEKQKEESPSLRMSDLTKYAKDIKLGIEAMNVGMMAAGIMPMRTSSMNLMNTLMVGKFLYDVHNYMKEKSSLSDDSLSPKVNMKTKDENVKTDENPSDALSIKKHAMSVKKATNNIIENLRNAIRNMKQFDEDAPDYEASTEMEEQVEHVIGDVVNTKEYLEQDAKERQQNQSLTNLQNVFQMGTGDKIFQKDPQDMSAEELNVNAEAVTAIMAPMKGSDGKYVNNFYDCYAVGCEEIPDMQKEYTQAATDLMIIGQPKEALAVREAQSDVIDASWRYKDMEKDDLTHVEDTTDENKEIQDRVTAAEDKKQSMIDLYKPLLMKAGLITAASAYEKHKYNQNFKDSVRERNLVLACQGTTKAMEESMMENKQLAQRALTDPYRGLLR